MSKRIILILTVALCVTQNIRAKELSRKEIESIADKYVDALNRRDFATLKAMYLDPDKLDLAQMQKYTEIMKQVISKGEEDGHFQIYVSYDWEKSHQLGRTYTAIDGLPIPEKQNHWILLAPDGKIKYDNAFIKHPILLAATSCINIEYVFGRTRSREATDRCKRIARDSYMILKESGLPLYGLDLNDDPTDISDSLEEIREWLEDNAESYDSSEPKVLLPFDL